MHDTDDQASLEQLRVEIQVGIDELNRGEGLPLSDVRQELNLLLEPPSRRFGRGA